MNTYLKDGRIPSESRDCSVIALSYAFGIDYALAHEVCKQKGRKNNQGFNLLKVFPLKLNDFKKFTIEYKHYYRTKEIVL